MSSRGGRRIRGGRRNLDVPRLGGSGFRTAPECNGSGKSGLAGSDVGSGNRSRSCGGTRN